MVLPDGFSLPPLSYLLVLLVAAAAVATALWRRRPPVREATVLAFVPWMVAGAACHVLEVIEAVPPAFAPLLGTPSVYVSTFVLAGAIWTVTDDRFLALAGTLAALLAVGAAFGVGYGRGTITPYWPLVALVLSIVLAAGTWGLFRRALPGVAATTGVAGALVVLAHALDGISTAVGIDVLEVTERSPLPRAIMGVAEGLPTAETIGVGWLFVLVKLALACVIVWLMAEYVEDEPNEGFLLLALIAAVGFGPGVHNLLLFAVGG
ncbi:DUF63 family protein [Halalkalicoccus jeotgali]|uniref:DUF63 domain-containing protein n=1 Tax=Halalkalicoccus jeotgali (strain DSM 18796 / CECT 7217 / JCM 14584 / KCTC 4019 / B3) TaxID=795797 RepID=D8JAG7_HALJB|nr:DUF63 family protein [Halalkalicoccus jeotgali]ADJ14689.1 hypothetical protein HacjB3_06490 [Halalkalicoccus jeotgali B3]ELY39587.1 hypothetical protein C497_04887 [Halalkalicoccus jeotgali B3]